MYLEQTLQLIWQPLDNCKSIVLQIWNYNFVFLKEYSFSLPNLLSVCFTSEPHEQFQVPIDDFVKIVPLDLVV